LRLPIWAFPALDRLDARIVSTRSGGVKGRLRRPLRGFALDSRRSRLRRLGIEVMAEECENQLGWRCNPARNGTAVTKYCETRQPDYRHVESQPAQPKAAAEHQQSRDRLDTVMEVVKPLANEIAPGKSVEIKGGLGPWEDGITGT
jgi:hypothetical protein